MKNELEKSEKIQAPAPDTPMKKKLRQDLAKLRQAQESRPGLESHPQPLETPRSSEELVSAHLLSFHIGSHSKDSLRLTQSASPAPSLSQTSPFPQESPEDLYPELRFRSPLTDSNTSLASTTSSAASLLPRERVSPFPLPSPDAKEDISSLWARQIAGMTQQQPMLRLASLTLLQSASGAEPLMLSRSLSTPRILGRLKAGAAHRVRISQSLELEKPDAYRPKTRSLTPPARSLSVLQARQSPPPLCLSPPFEMPTTYLEKSLLTSHMDPNQQRQNRLKPGHKVSLHERMNRSLSPKPGEPPLVFDKDGSREITRLEKKGAFADGHRYSKILMLCCGTFNDAVALAILLDTCDVKCSIQATEGRTLGSLTQSGQLEELKDNIKKLQRIHARGVVKIKLELGIDCTNLLFHVKQKDIDQGANIVYALFPYARGKMSTLVKQLFQSVNAYLELGGEFRLALTPLEKYNANMETANLGTQLRKNSGHSIKWSENHEFFLDDYSHRRTIPGNKEYLGCRSVDIASRLFFYTKVPEVQRGLNAEAHSPDSRKKIERDKRKKQAEQASIDMTQTDKLPAHRKLFG